MLMHILGRSRMDGGFVRIQEILESELRNGKIIGYQIKTDEIILVVNEGRSIKILETLKRLGMSVKIIKMKKEPRALER